jgi:hypothetical protein
MSMPNLLTSVENRRVRRNRRRLSTGGVKLLMHGKAPG